MNDHFICMAPSKEYAEVIVDQLKMAVRKAFEPDFS